MEIEMDKAEARRIADRDEALVKDVLKAMRPHLEDNSCHYFTASYVLGRMLAEMGVNEDEFPVIVRYAEQVCVQALEMKHNAASH